jgi:ATP-dependent exoDNAse (exonuclease V) alpha subunit
MKKNPKYALKHLSIRVPWHDNGWNGTICNNPSANGACLILKNCALNRNDEQEESLRGQSIEKMPQSSFPVCVGERGTFMAPFVFNKEINHPYVISSPETHGHLKSTTLRYPAFSASAVPYNWMLKENAEEKAALFSLDYLPDREPELKFKDSWIQEYSNQKALLNCFFEHLEENTSLVFLYAKQVPFYEGSGRVLVGVGRILHIEESGKYGNSKKGSLECGYWEHMIQHSIRKEFKDGFLLPYHEAIKYQLTNPEFNVSDLAVITPQDKGIEFSFAAEHVSNDTSIRVLLQCLASIETAEKYGIGVNHTEIKQWIHDRIHELEKLRGDYPGMGAALCAFGIEKGHFVASEIISSINTGANPWVVFLKLCNNEKGLITDGTAKLIPDTTKRLYRTLLDAKDDSIELLHLLSRFDINQDQAKFLFNEDLRKKEGIKLKDKAFIENPYLLYEITRLSNDPVNITTIDFGIFLSKGTELLPRTLSISPEDYTNPFRIRAIIIQQLELAAVAGHTLLSQVELNDQIHKLPIKPACPINPLYFKMTEAFAEGGFVKVELKDGEPAYQLSRLADMGKIIRDKVNEEASNARIAITSDWRKLLDEELDKGEAKKLEDTEKRAREEKAAALKELAESRISVLIGPAGTGKTTLLTILSKHPEIKTKGIVFLAPTGKARVRMEQVARGLDIPAFTLAQFLNKLGRFDGKTQRYKLSAQKWENPCETVILDEASMLTEEMLSSLIDSFKNVKRFILVGDSRQLPPIGPGRPFVDVIQRLKPNTIATQFPKVGSGYVELTIKRRFVGLNRQDIQLAEWFSGNALEPGEDHVINEVLNNSSTPTLRLVNWKNESDFEDVFKKVLIQELGLSNIDDIDKFNISLGATPDGKWFNRNSAVNKIEDWQILSPVKEKTFGVRSINRTIHKQFRSSTVEWANKYFTQIPFPAGNEEIVYGDKVINLNNQTVWENKVWPKDGMNYIANGEIGIVTGQTTFGKKGAGKPQNIHIEFSSQKGYQYSFWQSEFTEEGQPPLELAYAITVHKSQGSEFGTVFIVIPNPCFILSREMLYTALTRQKNKVVVLYQGNVQDLKKYSSDYYSDALGRITNLFEKPSMKLINDKFLEEHLIHMATDGTLLRSKSELLIYQRLYDKGLNPQYELPLPLGGMIKFPDFTIEDKKTNKKYFWEHCGLLFDAEYKGRWEEKKEWYKANRILPIEQGGGENGSLIVSSDDPVSVEGEIRGAFSYVEIDQLILNVFSK